MTKYRIHLINVGREKYNEIFIKSLKDIHTAESFALKEVKKHLLSGIVELVEEQVKGTYIVRVGGWRPVGLVTIQVVK